MLRPIIFFAALLSVTQTVSAGFLDKVGAVIDATLTPTPTTAKPQLTATAAIEHKLPKQWRSYWLASPESGTNIFLADTGNITAPVIFMVHGLGQNGLRDWLPLVPELEKHYRVILIDLPGFANSPSPKAKLSPSRYADLLHFIKPYFSNKPISVVGHSMGGAVALRYAQRYPEDIKQIALIDAAGILQRTAFVKHSATDRIPVNLESMPNTLLSYAIGLQDFSNNLIEKMLRLPDPTSALGKSELAWGATLQNYPNINAALSLMEEDFSSAIFEQVKPVAILWGEQDQIAPPRTGQVLHANIANSQLQLITNAAHVPMATHSQEVSAWLLQVLQSKPAMAAMQTAKSTTSLKNYDCNNGTGEKIRGHFARISINKCTGLLLDQVTADELVVHDSVIEIQNSHFPNAKQSLSIKDSVVMMTAGSIAGTVSLDKARIDFAGVNLHNPTPFVIKEKSRLILSVNRAGSTRYLHQDISLENTTW